MTRRCRRCGTDDHYASGQCKACQRARARAYVPSVAQTERKRQTNAAWRTRHADLMYQRTVAWRAANHERARAIERKSRAKQNLDPEYRRRKVLYENERRRRIQREAIEHYGGRCFCCRESIPLFLSLDHIHGGGTKQRRELRGKMRVAEWAKRNGWPPIFQVACHNCNKGRDMNGGICPHAQMEA